MHDSIKAHLLHGASDQDTDIRLTEMADTFGIETNEGMIWKLAFAQEVLSKGAQMLSKVETPASIALADKTPNCSWAAAQIITRLAEERKKDTLREALRIVAYTNRHIHPLALPAILSSLQHDYPFYPDLRKTMGSRADWLSKQNQKWTWWLDSNSPIGEDDAFAQWWPKYIMQFSVSAEQANAAIIEKLDVLDTTAKLKLAGWLNQHPDESNLAVLPRLLPSRSGKLRRAVLNAVLRNPQNPHTKEIESFALPRLQGAIAQSQTTLNFSPSNSAVVTGITFKLSDIELYSEYFSNPQWRLFCMVAPAKYLEDPSSDFVVTSLMENEGLERLAQMVICGASHHNDQDLVMALLETYLRLYPAGNTVGLQIQPLTQSLNTDQLRTCIGSLLKTPSRFFEKLALVLHGNTPYVSRSLSEAIIERIHEATISDLPFNEIQQLNRLLPTLGNRLDPRIFPKLRSLWSNDYYMGVLTKNINIFHQTMEQRHRLLESIAHSYE
ncbi:MAG: hypothetical protein KTR24_12510 [Saprospiraceae bacterium]|nr:hypothetical protein [Saprospiraceae bacterium]